MQVTECTLCIMSLSGIRWQISPACKITKLSPRPPSSCMKTLYWEATLLFMEKFISIERRPTCRSCSFLRFLLKCQIMTETRWNYSFNFWQKTTLDLMFFPKISNNYAFHPSRFVTQLEDWDRSVLTAGFPHAIAPRWGALKDFPCHWSDFRHTCP